jgi:3-hydroxyisobutyrate dehydrogenase-like beta-hydroxyacid dehydrogenase
MSELPSSDVTLIGFGEAGSAFARGGAWGERARVFDIRWARPDVTARMAETKVFACGTSREAIVPATVILSLVTADQSTNAAADAARYIAPGALYFDMNSVAPGTKQESASVIEAAGGRYVDVAVMSPVNPAQLAVPLYVSGPHSKAGIKALSSLGFTNIRYVGDTVGRASTIKMLRSVMYKGLEALTAECLIAAQRAGVVDEVLHALEPDWSGGANYRISRMMVHGLRRAAEMEESAKTLASLGVEPLMTRGTVEIQRAIGAQAIVPPSTLGEMLEILEA